MAAKKDLQISAVGISEGMRQQSRVHDYNHGQFRCLLPSKSLHCFKGIFTGIVGG